MFLRDIMIVRKIKLPTIVAEDRARVKVEDLGIEESEAKNANIMFAVHVGSNGIITHGTQVTWAFAQVGDDYCLVATDNDSDFATGQVYHVFIQIEAPVGEVDGTAYTQA